LKTNNGDCKKRLTCQGKEMPEALEKRILSAMDKCREAVETMKSQRQVDPKKLNQPFDL